MICRGYFDMIGMKIPTVQIQIYSADLDIFRIKKIFLLSMLKLLHWDYFLTEKIIKHRNYF